MSGERGKNAQDQRTLRPPGAASEELEPSQPIPLDSVPRIVTSKGALMQMPLDHRAGFLLSFIDGSLDVQTLIDVSAMPRFEIIAQLEELRRLGVIAF